MNGNRKVVFLAAALATVFSMSLTGCDMIGGKKTVAVTTAEETTVPVTTLEETTEPETEAPTTEEETPAVESAETAEPEVLLMYTTSKLNLRAEPNTDAEILTVIPLAAEIEVLEEGTEWHKVSYEGKEGFVSAEYVTKDPSEAGATAPAQTKKQAETTKKASESTTAREETKKETQKETEATKQETEASKPESEPAEEPTEKSDDGGNETEAPKQETEALKETDPPKQETEAPTKKERKEVSRKKYDDSDGSGHGYWEINYDDGTTEIIEY